MDGLIRRGFPTGLVERKEFCKEVGRGYLLGLRPVRLSCGEVDRQGRSGNCQCRIRKAASRASLGRAGGRVG